MAENSVAWVKFRPPEEGETAGQGTVIGEIPCHACGAPCLVKVNKGRGVYSYCNGHHPRSDGQGCNASYRWGGGASRTLIATWSKSKPEDVKDDETSKAGTGAGGDNNGAGEPAEQPKGQSASGDWFDELYGT